MWEGVRFLHLLGMAAFVGGQLLLGAGVVPVLRGKDDSLREIARRFGVATVVAGLVLVATGVAQASHYDKWGDSTLHVKLTLVVILAGLIAWHMRRPRLHALDGAIFLCSLVVVWLGISLAH